MAFSFSDTQTPKKVTFARLKNSNFCLLCGDLKKGRHMRYLNNVALRTTYFDIVKAVFLIEIPRDGGHKICEPCANNMLKVSNSLIDNYVQAYGHFSQYRHFHMSVFHLFLILS